MRWSGCDKAMTDKEIQYRKEDGKWELCSVCLDVAMDAAYSDGFQNEDDEGSVILVGEESSDDQLSGPLTTHRYQFQGIQGDFVKALKGTDYED